MKELKSIVYSFFLGGLLALIAQAFLTITTTAFAGGPLEFFSGGMVLVLMGVVGCIFGGLAIYQYFEQWCTFGALLPFSGFAMAVGMKMIGPWTKENASTGKSIWQGLWLVIWFNVIGALVCILFGFACTKAGIIAQGAPKTEGSMIFPLAFLMGGCLTAIYQVVWICYTKISNEAAPVWVLLAAWMIGCLLTPCGLSPTLANVFGEGFSVMIPVGGYNMYNVGMCFALGEMSEGFVHLGGFLLAVFFLFFTGLCTYLIYRANYKRTPISEIHFNRAKAAVETFGGSVIVPEFERVSGIETTETLE